MKEEANQHLETQQRVALTSLKVAVGQFRLVHLPRLSCAIIVASVECVSQPAPQPLYREGQEAGRVYWSPKCPSLLPWRTGFTRGAGLKSLYTSGKFSLVFLSYKDCFQSPHR